ncbi:MAG: hypothetical protein NT169_27735 [Chloroflexi bacterium]|nr:hypothetical protein [Chloroflexota bacterium]
MTPDIIEERDWQDIVYALATSPAFAVDRICFAARSSGLYGSTDGGVTWRSLYDSLQLETALTATAVAVSSSFAADRTLFAGTLGGVLRSADGGRTWEVAVLPSPPPLVVALAISPNYSQDGLVFAAAAQDGVYRSADRGRRWVAWNFGLLDLNILSLALSPGFAADETLFVGTESGVFRSTNGGRAWRETGFPSEWAPVLSLALSPEYDRDGVLFAGTEACGLCHSRDRGQTWERIGEAAIPETVNAVVVSPRYPAQPAVVALTGEGLLLSTDDGGAWTDLTAGMAEGEELTCVAAPLGLDADAPVLAGLTNGAVLRLAVENLSDGGI